MRIGTEEYLWTMRTAFVATRSCFWWERSRDGWCGGFDGEGGEERKLNFSIFQFVKMLLSICSRGICSLFHYHSVWRITSTQKRF